jgi:hypothetical protein
MKRRFTIIALCAVLAVAASFTLLSRDGRRPAAKTTELVISPDGTIAVPQNDSLTMVAEVRNPTTDVSPKKAGLEDVVAHFERSGIKGVVRPMPPINPDIVDLVTITLDTGGHGNKMVCVARCNDEAGAIRSFEDARKNPVFGGTTRNGVFVMFCTFVPAAPEKATEVQEIFQSYKP